ncbi:hypothetical protein GCM10009665_00640 [Kitasatospora nipponensis]|uniref:Glycerol-3-phosphate dehydrogenase n=1 Tax=Kitasatospora nipponensis TaxID=258049 RepID=A0ABP4G786_9ACTN
MSRTGTLGPAQRDEALAALGGGHFDVVVIGGGVTGCGVALDAATRGLSVALVEACDYAAGTSSRSSKLIHGGLRYLEQRDFALVREALRERGLLLATLAPHLVRPVRFLLPLTRRIWQRAYLGAGVALYDLLGGARSVPRHRHLTKRQALREAPGLDPKALTGAIQYYDAQMDDARFTVTLARTAAEHGAVVATGVRVVALLQEQGRVTGVRVRDTEGGGEYEVSAGQVINATGSWSDDLHALAGLRGQRAVRASKGVHLVVPRERIRLAETGLISRTEKSVLFVIPWGAHWIVGTTDTEWDLGKDHPAATATDVDYLLDCANRLLADPLTHDDVVGVYAGLRPLIDSGSHHTARLSREHVVWEPVPGLLTVAGGKFTTYRVMARDAVDVAVRALERDVPPSRTESVPLLGAVGFEALWANRARLAVRYDLPLPCVEHLLQRYGVGVNDLFALLRARPELALPLEGAPGYLAGELVYAASHEGALHLVDALTRRTRISVELADRGLAAAPAGPPPLWRSRPTAAGPPPGRPPACWARCWAGTSGGRPRRSTTTAGGWPPSCCRSVRPTTRARTPPGPPCPTRGSAGSSSYEPATGGHRAAGPAAGGGGGGRGGGGRPRGDSTMIVALLVVSGAAHAIWNAQAKRIKGDRFVFIASLPAVMAVLVGPWAVPHLSGALSAGVGLLVLGQALLQLLYFGALARAYELVDLSVAYPVARSAAPLVSAGCALALLHERPGPLGLLGVLITSASIAWLARGARGDRALGRPRLSVSGLCWALAAGTFAGLFLVVDKEAVARVDPVTYLFLTSVTVSVLLYGWLLARGRAAAVGALLRGSGGRLAVCGVLACGAYLSVLISLAHARATYVAPLRELSILYGVLAGRWLLREGDGARPLPPALGMVLGLLLVSLPL